MTFPIPTTRTTSVGCVQPVHRPFPTRPTLRINNNITKISTMQHSWVYTTWVHIIITNSDLIWRNYMYNTTIEYKQCTHIISRLHIELVMLNWSESLRYMLSTGAHYAKWLHSYMYTALYIIHQCGLKCSIVHTISDCTSSTSVLL